jgi:hypothetical protein
MMNIVVSKRSESDKLELRKKRGVSKRQRVTTSDKGRHKKLPFKRNVTKLLSKTAAGTSSAFF